MSMFETGITNTAEQSVTAAAEKVALDNEIGGYLADLRKLSRDYHNDGEVAARSIKALESNRPTDPRVVRAQRISDLRHYLATHASQYAYNKLVELTGEDPHPATIWTGRPKK